MKRFILGWLVFLVLSKFACAQEPWLNNLVEHLEKYSRQFPQEKIFLHTDRSWYFPGETIWYSIYQVDGVTFKPNSLSRVIYVDLLNEKGDLVKQQKIYTAEGRGVGDLQLDHNLATGSYLVRAYTYWMSVNDQYIFQKPVNVLHPDLKQFNPVVESSLYGTENTDYQMLRLHFEIDQATTELMKTYQSPLKYTLFQDSTVLTVSEVQPGAHHWTDTLHLENIAMDKDIYLRWELDELQRMVQVNPVQKINTRLFPEGGEMVAGIPGTVAFEFSGTELGSGNPNGKIVNSAGIPVVEFQPKFQNVGAFIFLPQPGESYRVQLWMDEKLIRQFPLENIVEQGITMGVNNRLEDKIRIRSVTNLENPRTVYLVAQARSIIYKILKGTYRQNTALLEIDRLDLPPGVVQLTLFTGVGIPVCERLIFNRPEELINPELQVKQRGPQQVELLLKSGNEASEETGATYSVAVVQQNYADVSATRIDDYLWIESESRGGIEIPTGLVNSNNPQLLDFVMLTRGWRRFEWKKIINNDPEEPAVLPEQGMSIHGIISRKDKKLNNADVILSILGDNPQFYQTTSDEAGHFTIRGVNFMGKENLILNAETPGGSSNVIIELKDLQPDLETAETTYPKQLIANEQLKDLPFLQQVRYLQNLVVEDESIGNSNTRIYGEADHVIDFARLSASGFSTIWEAIQGIPGVSITGNTVRVRGLSTLRSHSMILEDTIIYTGDSNEPLFLLNNVMVDKETFDNINPLDIQTIEILKTPGKKGIYGSRGTNGVILVFLKDAGYRPEINREEQNSQARGSKGILKISRQGYYRARQFYLPPESLQHQNFTPATLYWQPIIRFNNKTSGTIGFNPQNLKGEYQVILQGITGSGQPVYASCPLILE